MTLEGAMYSMTTDHHCFPPEENGLFALAAEHHLRRIMQTG
jgi:hypothetical protein